MIGRTLRHISLGVIVPYRVSLQSDDLGVLRRLDRGICEEAHPSH
jgi:hypothetical protein